MIAFGSLCLFGWSWTGHHEITVAAVTMAINMLTRNGGLSRLKMYASELKQKLEKLSLAVCLQDIDKGNAAGKIYGGEVKGGQIPHFMRDSWVKAFDAYNINVFNIKNRSLESLREFRKACSHSKNAAVAFLERNIVDGYQWDMGVSILAMALHPLQDSYAEGHVQRDLDTETIQDVHAWDSDNRTVHRDKETGRYWEGHDFYDDQWSIAWGDPKYGRFTQAGALAGVATAELIACVLNEAAGPSPENAFMGAISRCLDHHLKQNIPLPRPQALTDMSPSDAARLIASPRR